MCAPWGLSGDRRWLRLLSMLLFAAAGCADTSPSGSSAPLVAIDIEAAAAQLTVGDSATLRAVLRTTAGAPVVMRPLVWDSSDPAVATVDSLGVVIARAAGQTVVSARREGVIGQLRVSVSVPVMRVTRLSPATWRPGEMAQVIGSGLSARGGLPTMAIGTLPVKIESSSDSVLTVRVPCLASGRHPLRLERTGTSAVDTATTLQVPRLTLARGAMALADAASAGTCVELESDSAAPRRFAVSAFNPSTDPTSIVPFEWIGARRTAPSALALIAVNRSPGLRSEANAEHEHRRDAWHLRHLERERAREGGRPANASRAAVASPRSTIRRMAAVQPGALRRFYFAASGFCGDTTRTVNARVAATRTRVVVWEDTTNTLQLASDAAYRDYLGRLLDIVEREQLPLVQRLVGDPLLRDAETDADGAVHLLLSERVNETGAGAFVSGCDLRPRRLSAASNIGEIIYAMVPTKPAANPDDVRAVDGWFAFMARTTVHELKHLASFTTRIARERPFDEVWLEEGTARMAEEAWVREFLHRSPARTNTPLGTAADGGLYCDFHTADATCASGDPRHRPSLGMRRHFNDLRARLFEPWDWSPFGEGRGQSGAVFYNAAWSLLRHVADHCCASDASFLTALNDSPRVGMENLQVVAGRPAASLIGAWGLALWLDDASEVRGGDERLHIRSWDLRAIYAGLNASPIWRERWPTPYPVSAVPVVPDTAATARFTGPPLRGGGHAYFDLRLAPRSTPYLLQLRSTISDPGSIRLIVARVE